MPIVAKSIIDDKFWIIEEDGAKIGTLRRNENRFMLSSSRGDRLFDKKDDLTSAFGEQFFSPKTVTLPTNNTQGCDARGYPTSCVPYNAMLDVKKKLPIFSKSKSSKSLFCAGYYIIKFEKGWVKSFCPKLITLDRYEFKGPFKTELEMRQQLSNVKSD